MTIGVWCIATPRSTAAQQIADGSDLAFFHAVEAGNNLLAADKRLRMVRMSVQDVDPVATLDAAAGRTNPSQRGMNSSRIVTRELRPDAPLKLSDVVPLALTVVSRGLAVLAKLPSPRATGAEGGGGGPAS